jgi:hypothetical protein
MYIDKTQSVGNYLYIILNRIFRDYTPKYFYYRRFLLLHSKKYSTNDYENNKFNYLFSTYLTGLIEGDGTIVVPKTLRSSKNKLNYPSIQIVFHLKDLPLALMIQKELGFGSIARKKGINAYILTINNHQGILSIIKIINGNMRTPKINSLYNLIDFYKDKISIDKLSLDTSSLESNA